MTFERPSCGKERVLISVQHSYVSTTTSHTTATSRNITNMSNLTTKSEHRRSGTRFHCEGSHSNTDGFVYKSPPGPSILVHVPHFD